MFYQFKYLYLTLAHSNDQGQDHAHLDYDKEKATTAMKKGSLIFAFDCTININSGPF